VTPPAVDPNLRLADTLLPEFDHETAITRQLLAVVPESRSAWRPRDGMPALAELVMQVVARGGDLALLLAHRDIDWHARSETPPRPFESMPAALGLFDRAVADSRAALAAASDDALLEAVSVTGDGFVASVQPRLQVIRSLAFNRLIHERGQLSMYLRLCDVRLPPIYGPAIDPPP
jgi:uncharacterized damage-inducible protein DinB